MVQIFATRGDTNITEPMIMCDPLVHIHKTVLMQRLLDSVARGYWWHTSGTVPLAKAERFSNKLDERYGVHRNANQRAYAKRMGWSNARLFLYASPNAPMLYWWLLATDGEGRVHGEERLARASDSRRRVRIGKNYELLRRTRPRAKGGGTVWTWRMTSECVGEWRSRILAACRRSDAHAVTQAIVSLYRAPGFSGIRHQVGKLAALLRSEWRRRHGNIDELLLPRVLPYVERLSDSSVPLSQVRQASRS